MSESIVLSAGLFTGQPVDKFVCFNEADVSARKAVREALMADPEFDQASLPEPILPRGATFSLLPIGGKLDSEYTKRRGQDKHSLKLRPRAKGESGPVVQFDAMEVSFSNEQEIEALIWLAGQVVKGWRGITLDDGTELEFTKHNLEKLASVPGLIRPVIAAAYELGSIQKSYSEGN